MEPISTGLITLAVGGVGRYLTRRESMQASFYARLYNRLTKVEEDLEAARLEHEKTQLEREIWTREKIQLGDKIHELEGELDRARMERMGLARDWAERERALQCELQIVKERLFAHERVCPGGEPESGQTPPSAS